MDQENSKNIGRRLTLVIESLNLKQKEFANSIGVAPSTVSAIINATYLPSADFLTRLLNKFNVNINFLLQGIGGMFLPDESTPATVDISSLKDIKNGDVLTQVMRESDVFKHSVLAHASSFFIMNKEMILKSLGDDDLDNGGL